MLPRIFLKIYVSENAFQAILKPIFSYSICSIRLQQTTFSDAFFLGALRVIVALATSECSDEPEYPYNLTNLLAHIAYCFE